jgi:WD40-like Beta Propeller Repeat
MNAGVDRQMFEFLESEVGPSSANYLDEVLERVADVRQRRAWTSIRRWVPLELPPTPWAFGRPLEIRAIVVLAILALVLAALGVMAIGSSRHFPPPYGLARNGLLISSSGGDLFRVDRATGATTPIVADGNFDFGPGFSRDGSKLLFLRAGPANCGLPDCGLMLVVANPDGSAAHAITPAVPGLDWVDWSPDSTRIAFISRRDGSGLLNVVNADGTDLRTLDVGRPAHLPSWLPPDGAEIVFRGEQLRGFDPPVGIFAVRPDGTGLRQISTRPPSDDRDYEDLALSPDGTRLLYRESGDHPRVHVLDLRSGADAVLPEPPGSPGEQNPIFSPDGIRVAYLRFLDSNFSAVQLIVTYADGRDTGVAIGPSAAVGPDGPTITNFVFTPDGTALVANFDEEHVTRLVPLDGSPPTVLSRGDGAAVGYQRVAP